MFRGFTLASALVPRRASRLAPARMGSAKKERAQTKRAAKQVTGTGTGRQAAGPASRGGRCVLPPRRASAT